MERLLVTGIDRPVGIDLALVLAEHCEVLGVYRDQVIETSALRTACWNAAGGASLAELTRDWRPQWILHCGPLATANWDPVPTADEQAREALALAELTALAEAHSARLTVLSSDAVFAGPRMFHDETSEATAASRWAASVRTLEQQLSARDTLIVRTHAYGWSPVSERAGFAERIWRGLSAGTLSGVDGRRHATPILATDLAELLWRAHEVRLAGMCHLAGAERTSPYHFAYALAAASNLSLPGVSAAANAAADDRTALEETSLSSRRARRAMERATPLLRPGLERFAAQRHNGWVDRYTVVGPVSSLAALAA